MSVYEDFGIKTIINVSGLSTRVSGALMPPQVVEAMAEAATESVSMVDLQAGASRYIASVTGAEAGYVTAGASSSLTLGSAAILAGLNPGIMDRLPDTTGIKNEFIIAREHRSGYDHAARLSGAKFVEVGMNEVVANAGVRRTEPWEYEAAITPLTAAIYYASGPDSAPPLTDVIEVAKKHNLPVIVDAAGELPPKANLRRFTDAGADLVAFSGGKALRGPQSSGILCGRRDLIASAALQHLDMDELFDIWDPPADFIPKDSLPGIPRQGIGRGFKVAKEEVVAMLTALKIFVEDGYDESYREQRGYLEYLADGLSGLPADAVIDVPDEGSPVMTLTLDEAAIRSTAFEIAHRLKSGEPRIFVQETGLAEGSLVINPINLDQSRTEALAEALRGILKA
jgi:D-glucosaminate-6-phosphate ammonia-lyase